MERTLAAPHQRSTCYWWKSTAALKVVAPENTMKITMFIYIKLENLKCDVKFNLKVQKIHGNRKKKNDRHSKF